MRTRRIASVITTLLPLLAAAAPARAQSGIELTVAERRLHYDYRFENDSSFDTVFLVPHFFEQRYEVTGIEIGARARYRVLGRALATTVSFAPERSAFGSDFDTFFQPDGDVATSGTAGGVDHAGVGVEQTIGLFEGERASLSARLAWRRDRADFHPADRVVTHTQPPSETREWITDRETTIARTFEIGVDGGWRRGALAVRAHASPTMRARLLTRLPDKYPGRDIIFDALAWGLGARVTGSRRVGAFEASVWASGEKIGSYRRAARHNRTALAAGVSLGVR